MITEIDIGKFDGQDFVVPPFTQFAIVNMVENASTGYSWSFDVDQSIVKLLAFSTSPLEDTKYAVCAASSCRWVFETRKEGLTSLVFRLGKPDDWSDPEDPIFHINIDCTKETRLKDKNKDNRAPKPTNVEITQEQHEKFMEYLRQNPAEPIKTERREANTANFQPIKSGQYSYTAGPAFTLVTPSTSEEVPARPVSSPTGHESGNDGLTINRRFTKEGEDVYETCKWRKTDAIITEPDGKVVFEQRDIELPEFYSDQAGKIIASKYFRGHVGQPGRETSVREMIKRVAETNALWGAGYGPAKTNYFATASDFNAFLDELTHILLFQKCAFNSPVWFNVGIKPVGEPATASACYINSVEDNLPSILQIGVTEGILFSGGSGSGVNVSKLRAKNEKIGEKGVSSGPLSFAKGWDAYAGAIKSAGKNRRAAKMLLMDADHPDIIDFIRVKAIEERKAHALIAAGYSGAFNVEGGAYETVAFQNANHSIRVTDEFMEAVESDGEWNTKWRVDGKTAKTYKAKDILMEAAEACHFCGCPGIQFDSTINRWHTVKNTDRIYASNPCCFVPTTLIDTYGQSMTIEELYNCSSMPLVKCLNIETGRPYLRAIKRVWIAGETKTIVRIRLHSGSIIECTPEHPFCTKSNGKYFYTKACHLNPLSDNLVLAMTGLSTVGIDSIEEVDLSKPIRVYDMEVDEFHNFAVFGTQDTLCEGSVSVIAHNSEFLHLDDTACNLASINLMKFRNDDGTFDAEGYKHTIDIMITAMEILVDNALYPTEKIANRTHEFRPLGLGYTNLGALLMSNGLAYDSDDARNYAALLAAILTGQGYKQSTVISRDCGGPFPGYTINRDSMLEVIGMHCNAHDYLIPTVDDDTDYNRLWRAGASSLGAAMGIGSVHGYRNAQISVQAPVGTISFLMDNATTGIEPELGLVKYKTLVAGGSLKMVNPIVPIALDSLGYMKSGIDKILKYIEEHDTIEGCDALDDEDLPVFDCSFKPANGKRSIDPMGHVKMLAAIQPFTSGGLSKTVNCPNDATVQDIFDIYVQAWKLGVKCIAIYRDGCKQSQPLNTSKAKEVQKPDTSSLPVTVSETVPVTHMRNIRRRLPDERASITHKFSIAGHEGYVTASTYPDTGEVGEIFITMSKEGSTLAGLMDSFATSISLGLQHGVSLDMYCNKFKNVKFEPSGYTPNDNIRFATSIIDYIFRWLEIKFKKTDVEMASEPITQTVKINDTGGVTISYPNQTYITALDSEIHGGSVSVPSVWVNTNAPTNQYQLDAPLCIECGSITVKKGMCYVCINCGSNGGCS